MSGRKGVNNTNLKQVNRGLVLKNIVSGECKTRTDLAKKTGLSKMSISNIVGEFLARGIISEEAAVQSGGIGRNPIVLKLTDRAPKLIGLNIHRSRLVAVLTDLRMNVLKSASRPLIEENSTHLFELMYYLIEQVMEGTDADNILGIGVGSSGPIDIEAGMILAPTNFFGLKDLKIVEALRKRYHMPVFMDSQYNCAAAAEKICGVGRDLHDFIFVGITDGIGSGIIMDERLFRNANGFTSELGHVSIDRNGPRCSCGNRGCLELYASEESVRNRLNEEIGKNYTFLDYCHLAELGETEAVNRAFDDMINALAAGCLNAVNLLNPEAIIIGDSGYFIPDAYLDRLQNIINALKLSGTYRYVNVLKSAFRDQAHIIGSVMPVLAEIFNGRISF